MIGQGRPSHHWAAGLSRKLAIMASGTLVSVGLSLLVSIVVARLLGPERLASYAAVMLATLLVAQLNDAGLAHAFAYYARHRPGALPTLRRILQRHLLFCTAAALLLVGAAPLLHPAFQQALSGWWFRGTLVALLVAGTAAHVLPALVLARGHYTAYVCFTNGTTAVQLGAVVMVFLLGGASWRGFVAAATAAHVLMALIQMAYVRGLSADATEHVTARECYGYGLRMKWAEVMKLLSGRIDLLLVTALLPRGDVGVYAVAISFRELGLAPFRTYAAIFQNLAVDRLRTGRDDRDLVLGSLFLQVALSLLLTAGAALTFPFALPWLYGRAYDNLPVPATILLASTVFLSIAGLSWTVFNMRGRPGMTSRILTISGVLGPVLVWIFTKQAGIMGAAAAGLLGSAIVCALSLAALFTLCGYSWHDAVRVARRTPNTIRELRIAGAATLRRAPAGAAVGRR